MLWSNVECKMTMMMTNGSREQRMFVPSLTEFRRLPQRRISPCRI